MGGDIQQFYGWGIFNSFMGGDIQQFYGWGIFNSLFHEI